MVKLSDAPDGKPCNCSLMLKKYVNLGKGLVYISKTRSQTPGEHLEGCMAHPRTVIMENENYMSGIVTDKLRMALISR